jgi:hypothetical protein
MLQDENHDRDIRTVCLTGRTMGKRKRERRRNEKYSILRRVSSEIRNE